MGNDVFGYVAKGKNAVTTGQCVNNYLYGLFYTVVFAVGYQFARKAVRR
jgi:hypothetical protein